MKTFTEVKVNKRYKVDESLSGFQGLDNEKSRTHKTLSEHKLHIDSCTAYNSCFIMKFLDHIGNSDVVVHGHYNAGTTISSQQGW